MSQTIPSLSSPKPKLILSTGSTRPRLRLRHAIGTVKARVARENCSNSRAQALESKRRLINRRRLRCTNANPDFHFVPTVSDYVSPLGKTTDLFCQVRSSTAWSRQAVITIVLLFTLATAPGRLCLIAVKPCLRLHDGVWQGAERRGGHKIGHSSKTRKISPARDMRPDDRKTLTGQGFDGAGRGNRTPTTLSGLRILSPLRLPVSPSRPTRGSEIV